MAHAGGLLAADEIIESWKSSEIVEPLVLDRRLALLGCGIRGVEEV